MAGQNPPDIPEAHHQHPREKNGENTRTRIALLAKNRCRLNSTYQRPAQRTGNKTKSGTQDNEWREPGASAGVVRSEESLAEMIFIQAFARFPREMMGCLAAPFLRPLSTRDRAVQSSAATGRRSTMPNEGCERQDPTTPSTPKAGSESQESPTPWPIPKAGSEKKQSRPSPQQLQSSVRR